MSTTHNCDKKCCIVKIKQYKHCFPYKYKNRKHKSGVFIIDESTNKVLLVQSKGRLWGSPKGSIEYNESHLQCAVREVLEETGIDISKVKITKYTKIQNKAVYYYINMKEINVNIQEIEGNDANGICWININCLNKCIQNGNMSISQHCRILFRKFLNIELVSSDFKTQY